jgi:hypothetical protein
VGILVVLLVIAWGLVLAPALVQGVASSPLHTERMFRKSIRALGRRPRPAGLGGRSILVPPKSSYPLAQAHGIASEEAPRGRSPQAKAAAERRRRNLTYLAVFIIATFALGLLPPLRFLLVLNLIADVLLILYLGLVAYMSMRPPASERAQAVPPAAGASEMPRAASAD